TVTVEWLEGERFLIHRARTDHPDFPDSISIIGFTDQDRVGDAPAAAGKGPFSMHYFDSRGVYRLYNASIDDGSWRFWRDAPGFSPRFRGTVVDGAAPTRPEATPASAVPSCARTTSTGTTICRSPTGVSRFPLGEDEEVGHEHI